MTLRVNDHKETPMNPDPWRNYKHKSGRAVFMKEADVAQLVDTVLGYSAGGAETLCDIVHRLAREGDTRRNWLGQILIRWRRFWRKALR